MDRKGLLIIIVTIGLAFGWHFFYAKPRQEEEFKKWKIAKEQYDAQQAKLKEEQAAAAPPATAPGAAATPNATPAAPVTPPAPVVEREKATTVSSEVGTVDYLFTKHGAGIERVVLKEHFQDARKVTPVVLNEFGTIPIGALSEQPGDEAFINQPWDMTVDEANRTVTFERVDDLR